MVRLIIMIMISEEKEGESMSLICISEIFRAEILLTNRKRVTVWGGERGKSQGQLKSKQLLTPQMRDQIWPFALLLMAAYYGGVFNKARRSGYIEKLCRRCLLCFPVINISECTFHLLKLAPFHPTLIDPFPQGFIQF